MASTLDCDRRQSEAAGYFNLAFMIRPWLANLAMQVAIRLQPMFSLTVLNQVVVAGFGIAVNLAI